MTENSAPWWPAEYAATRAAELLTAPAASYVPIRLGEAISLVAEVDRLTTELATARAEIARLRAELDR
jgi:hypothetical protein